MFVTSSHVLCIIFTITLEFENFSMESIFLDSTYGVNSLLISFTLVKIDSFSMYKDRDFWRDFIIHFPGVSCSI